MNEKKSKSKKASRAAEDAALAEEYATTPRTVSRWRSQHAPLDDPTRMRLWLANRKNIPARTLSKLLAEQKQTRAATAVAAAALTPGEAGAPHVLKRLEAAEESAHRAVRAAEHGGDPISIRVLTQRWMSLARELLRYDLAVLESRRDSGALIPREDVERIVAGIGWHLTNGIRTAFQYLPPLLVGLRDPHEIGRVIKETLDRVDIAAPSAVSEHCKVPAWALKSLAKGLTSSDPGAEQNIERHKASFQSWVSALAHNDASEAVILMQKRNLAITRWRAAKDPVESNKIWDEECRPLGL